MIVFVILVDFFVLQFQPTKCD